MNRIITILVTIFILLLLYIWISHVWGSDSPRHPRQIVDATQNEILGADDTDSDMDTSLTNQLLGTDDSGSEEYNSMNEDDARPSTDEMAEENNSKQLTEEPVKSEPVKPAPVKTPVTEEKKPTVTKTETKKKISEPSTTPVVKTSQPIAKPTQVSASGDGKHLVIAGNFLQLVNANQRLTELKKAGFGEVEVVNFDLSEYHTVCAGRFDDVNEARRLVKKLKDYHKIDAYVRIGS